jgi:hypothetical protein
VTTNTPSFKHTELGYLRCHCGRFVANIVRRTKAEYGPYNPWYGWHFKDFGMCKVHGEVEIIADGDMFGDENE